MQERLAESKSTIPPSRHQASGPEPYAQVKFLQMELCLLSANLGIPFHVLGTSTVPNLTTTQKTELHRSCRHLMSSCNIPAWEKQAWHEAVRVVRSNLETLHRV